MPKKYFLEPVLDADDSGSIKSVETIGSATTLVAPPPEYRPAFEQQLSFLRDDPKLQPLFVAASQKILLDGGQFRNGLRKLLKTFAQDLMRDPAPQIKQEAIQLLSVSARLVSHDITRFYFESEKGLLQVESPNLDPPPNLQNKHKSSIGSAARKTLELVVQRKTGRS